MTLLSPLLLTAVLLRRRCCWALCSSRSIYSTHRAQAANPPHAAAAVDSWDGRTDGRTPYRYTDPVAYYASSVSERCVSYQAEYFIFAFLELSERRCRCFFVVVVVVGRKRRCRRQARLHTHTLHNYEQFYPRDATLAQY